MLGRFLTPRPGGTPARYDDPFSALHREINRVFEDMTRGFGTAVGMPAGWQPSVELTENTASAKVTAELPGMDEKDVEVSLEQDLLTIKGEKKAESEREEEGVKISERSYGSFQRVITLPFAPDPDKVEARFEKGVLTITLPRPPEATPATRRIAIGKG